MAEPTHLLFLDDSGTKEFAEDPSDYDTTGKSRYFVFGGALMKAEASGPMVSKIRALKADVFSDDAVEIKSNWLRMPWEREKRYLEPYGVTEEELVDFVDAYYGIVENTELLLLACVVDKVHAKEDYGDRAWYPPAAAYEFLLQRVVQEVNGGDQVAVTIDDMMGATPAGNQYKKNLTLHHAELVKYGSRLRRDLNFSVLTHRCRFQDSAVSHQIQIADIVAYNVYRQFLEHGEDWEKASYDAEGHAELATYPWFERLAGKFRQGPAGRIQGYGVVKFPLRNRVPWGVSNKEEAAP